MGKDGLFTRSDLATIGRAASLAELLTQNFFDLAKDEWKRNPCEVFSRKYVTRNLYEDSAFASVIRYGGRCGSGSAPGRDDNYGIVLQDPNILLALLRSWEYDLWSVGLFVLTHELIHIVRFRKFGVDFFASAQERDTEEKLVCGITREVLSGNNHGANIQSLYKDEKALYKGLSSQTPIGRR